MRLLWQCEEKLEFGTSSCGSVADRDRKSTQRNTSRLSPQTLSPSSSAEHGAGTGKNEDWFAETLGEKHKLKNQHCPCLWLLRLHTHF